MAGGPKLDGAGAAKMTTLDEALVILSRVHSLVERYAIEIRSNKNTSQPRQQIQRATAPLVGKLKGQFGRISDQVTAMLLVLSRGGSEQTRLRSLRESVAQIRTALEIAVKKVIEHHEVKDEE